MKLLSSSLTARVSSPVFLPVAGVAPAERAKVARWQPAFGGRALRPQWRQTVAVVLVREGSLWSLAFEEAPSGPQMQTMESPGLAESEWLSHVCLSGEGHVADVQQACESWAPRFVSGRGLPGEGRPPALLGAKTVSPSPLVVSLSPLPTPVEYLQ